MKVGIVGLRSAGNTTIFNVLFRWKDLPNCQTSRLLHCETATNGNVALHPQMATYQSDTVGKSDAPR